jgi:esterase/lipase superfamily enzyme
MRTRITPLFWSAVLLALLASGGCQTRRTLATTPNIWQDGRGAAIFEQVPPDLRTADMDVLYVTDRAVLRRTDVGPFYGHTRSRTVTFGSAVVSIQPRRSWEQLVADSLSAKRSTAHELKTTSIREIGTFTSPLEHMEFRRRELALKPGATTQIAAEQKQFTDELEARLARTQQKDVFIYVHGFANSFDDSVFRIAELWHFMGRVGVPIAYTWPAGSSGIFAYFKDRESGEYTIFHLKQLLLLVMTCPSVQRVHLIGHSRGTDVVTTAIRELSLELDALDPAVAQQRKLETLVLASPDLDGEVFGQRFIAERLVMLPNRMVVYFSPNDLALKLSVMLFGGQRLGRLDARSFTPEMRQRLSAFQTLELIKCEVTGYSTSHDYEFAHPAVLSDLVLVLRDRRDPGAANGRPLRAPTEGIWEITNHYGLPAKEAPPK